MKLKDKDYVIKYKQKLSSFIDLSRYSYPVIAVALSGWYLYKGVRGIPLYMAFAVSLLMLLIVGICFLHINNHMVLTKESLTINRYKKETVINFKDVTRLRDSGSHLEIYTGDQLAAKISGFTYDVNDLLKIVMRLEEYGISLEEEEDRKPLFPEELMRKVLIGLMVFNMIYFIFCMITFPKSMALFYIISLILPIFVTVYYYYLFLHDRIELLVGYRPALLIDMIIPHLALWIQVGRHFSMTGISGIIYTTIALFILWVILFNLLSNISGVGRDSFKMAQTFIMIPLLLVLLNNYLPPLTSTTTSQVVTDVYVSNTKLSTGYMVKTTDDEGHVTRFNIPEAKAYLYATKRDKKEKVTVKTSKGIFNLTYSQLIEE